jgi:outer membrane protein assembly factor BamB
MFMHDPAHLGLADAATDPRGLSPWSLSLGSRPGASPVVRSGIAYIGTEAGDVVAIDTVARTERWIRPLSAPVHSAPAVTAQTVVVSAHGLYGLRAADGTIRWQRPEIIADDTVSPTLVQNSVLIGAGSSVYAVDADSGQNVWPAPTELPGALTVAATSAADTSLGLLFIVISEPSPSAGAGGQTGMVAALRLKDGALAWTAPIHPSGAPPFGLTVGTVPGGARPDRTALFVAAGGAIVALDATSGALLWTRTATDGDFHSPPLLISTAPQAPWLLFAGTAPSRSNSEQLFAFEPASGVDLPSHRISPMAAVTGSLALAGNLLYVPTTDGLVAVDTGTGAVYWTSPMAAASGVAVAGGLPYVATEQGLFVGFSMAGAAPSPTSPALHDLAITGIQAPATVSRSTDAAIYVLLTNRAPLKESYHIFLRYRPGDVLINDFIGTIDAGQTKTIGFIWKGSEMGEVGLKSLVSQVLIQDQADSNPADNTYSQSVTVGP